MKQKSSYFLPCKGSLVRNRGFKRTWIRPSVFVRPQKPGDLPNDICAGFIQPDRYNISSGPKRDPKRLSFKGPDGAVFRDPQKVEFFEKLQKFYARPGSDFDDNFAKTVHIPFAKLKMSTIKSPIAGHLPCGSSLVYEFSGCAHIHFKVSTVYACPAVSTCFGINV